MSVRCKHGNQWQYGCAECERARAFGIALREARIASGVSLREAAALLSTSAVRLGEVERGVRTGTGARSE